MDKRIIQVGDIILYQQDSMILPVTARVVRIGPVGIRVHNLGSDFDLMLCLRTDWIRVLPYDENDKECNFTLPEFEVDYDGPDIPLEYFEE